MDTSAKVWRWKDGQVLHSFDEHCGEIISISFNNQVKFYFDKFFCNNYKLGNVYTDV